MQIIILSFDGNPSANEEIRAKGRSESRGNHTRLWPGDGALVYGDPLAHIVERLQRDDIVGAGV